MPNDGKGIVLLPGERETISMPGNKMSFVRAIQAARACRGLGTFRAPQAGGHVARLDALRAGAPPL
jgi:hypothetical protein